MNTRVVRIGLLVAMAAAGVQGCRSRQVEVRTAPPSTQSGVSVQVTNGLPQAVNVWVSLSGTDTFLRQVPAAASPTNPTVMTIPVQGFAPGSSVTLKAVTLDGVRTFQRQNVVLTGTVTFQLP
jgi:hypothetical protein